MTVSGGAPSARFARDGRPAAQVPPCSTLASGKRSLHRRPSRCRNQRREAVEQRHRQRAPFDHQWRSDLVRARRVGGIAQHQHAGIDEQAAIAVFGKAGQAVDVGDRDAGPLQRLDQRIGEPLRQLVQRHEAARSRRAVDQRRMAPAIAERDAAERHPRRPDRPELQQQFATGCCGAGDRPAVGLGDEMIEQPAGPRRVVAGEYFGVLPRRGARAGAAVRRGLRGRPADCRR